MSKIEKATVDKYSRQSPLLERLSKDKRYTKWIGLILLGVLITIPITNFLITGSPFGVPVEKPPIANPEYHIGYGKVAMYAMDMENESYLYVPVPDAKVTFINYYTEEIISEDNVADGTVDYYFDNVTMGFMDEFTFHGYNYPSKCFVIYTNETLANSKENIININPFGKPSELDYRIKDLITEDNLALQDIYDAGEEQVNITLRLMNNGGAFFGETNYVPIPFRYNESIGISGLWLKFNTQVNEVLYGDGEAVYRYVYYDNGNTYILLDTVSPYGDINIQLKIAFISLPTEMNIIIGQINGEVLKTETAV